MDLSGLEGMKGNVQIVIYLADSKQVKYMRPEYNISADERVLHMFKARFGDGNVKINIR